MHRRVGFFACRPVHWQQGRIDTASPGTNISRVELEVKGELINFFFCQAAMNGHQKCIHALIRLGVNIEARNSQERSALHQARKFIPILLRVNWLYIVSCML